MDIRLMSPVEICSLMGARLRAERLRQNVTQKELAAKAGVSLPTVQRFETKGSGTLETFAALLTALHRIGDLESVAAAPPPATFDELMAAGKPTAAPRQRASGRQGRS